MTRRISSFMLIAVALPTLSACDVASVNPAIGGVQQQLEAPAPKESEGSLFMKWLTRPPGGVNGMKSDD